MASSQAEHLRQRMPLQWSTTHSEEKASVWSPLHDIGDPVTIEVATLDQFVGSILVFTNLDNAFMVFSDQTLPVVMFDYSDHSLS